MTGAAKSTPILAIATHPTLRENLHIYFVEADLRIALKALCEQPAPRRRDDVALGDGFDALQLVRVEARGRAERDALGRRCVLPRLQEK